MKGNETARQLLRAMSITNKGLSDLLNENVWLETELEHQKVQTRDFREEAKHLGRLVDDHCREINRLKDELSKRPEVIRTVNVDLLCRLIERLLPQDEDGNLMPALEADDILADQVFGMMPEIKISAIRIFRLLTGLRLKDSKERIDLAQVRYGHRRSS